MTWLFGQLWFLILIGYLVGSLVVWAVLRMSLPHADELESLSREVGSTEGVNP